MGVGDTFVLYSWYWVWDTPVYVSHQIMIVLIHGYWYWSNCIDFHWSFVWHSEANEQADHLMVSSRCRPWTLARQESSFPGSSFFFFIQCRPWGNYLYLSIRQSNTRPLSEGLRCPILRHVCTRSKLTNGKYHVSYMNLLRLFRHHCQVVKENIMRKPNLT